MTRVWTGGETFKAQWSLGHYPYGDWVDTYDNPLLITTTRAPLARLTSYAAKHHSCKGTSVALRFWGSRSPDVILSRFDEIWITERYNESLVAFALRYRLRLGDVLPPLAKFHRRTLEVRCGMSTDLDIEERVHERASRRLDERLAHVDSRLVAVFSKYLDRAMSLGRTRVKDATLLMDDCARRCVADALNAAVRITYK